MSKLMKSYLLAFLAVGVLSASAQAAAPKTKFTDVQCRNLTVTGTLTNAGCSCTNTSFASTVTFDQGIASTTGTFSGAVDVTGLLSTSASTPYALRISSANISLTGTPDAAGILGLTSAYVLYVSTGGPASWVKVGGQ